MYFSMDTRPKVIEENPGIKFGDVGKKLGQMWKELPEGEKEKYNQKAADDKKRYEREMAEEKGKPVHDADEDD